MKTLPWRGGPAILLATGPRGGEGMTFNELSLDELKDPAALIMKSFFTPSENSQAAGRAYLKRLKLRAADRDAPVSMKSAAAMYDISARVRRNTLRLATTVLP